VAKKPSPLPPQAKIEPAKWEATTEEVVFRIDQLLDPAKVAEARAAAAKIEALVAPSSIRENLDAVAAWQHVVLALAQHFPPDQLYAMGAQVMDLARLLGHRPPRHRPRGSGSGMAPCAATIEWLASHGISSPTAIARYLLTDGIYPSGVGTLDSQVKSLAEKVAKIRNKGDRPMTNVKRIKNNPVINPRSLPWQAWVNSWHVSYHRTEAAAERKARSEANAAARHCNGPAPHYEVRQVVFDAAGDAANA
jgi:hypothetical protein